MTTLYATVAEFKTRLGISDTSDDAALTTALNAACRSIDKTCGRRFWVDTEVVARTFRIGYGAEYGIRLPAGTEIASTTGLIIKTDDNDDGTFETTWASTDYELGPTNALAGSEPVREITAVGDRLFPTGLRRSALQITALWGWPAVPSDIKEATLLLAGRFFKRKDSPHGVAGFNDFGVVRLSNSDPDVALLIQPYRIIGLA